MKRDELKKILLKHYSKDSVKSILCGRMKPSIEKRIALNNEFDIPILSWENIKSYLGENISTSVNEGEVQKIKQKYEV
ncbi:MAG: hypothetical protein RBR93_08065 [Aliarcobacter butzleri]|uniref:hypothetical protein n=2 Tax=Aliarcobacter butzleri TaxID=28197 RepID=UPI00263DD511|nr:hypothetical protein [Aliarcobacter butzleri]MDN5061347.1 hypothetical protein [Aliarcobacter butzleri]MDY0193467.1 hypothetical protein [Aliarcobacter butzleri]